MKIKFEKIKLHNFLSFESSELSLGDSGYTLVNGVNENPDDNATSNGSGKSSIWEAISWCLTGETIRGTKEVTRLGVEDKCEVELTFKVDNDEYVITRTKDPSNLKVFINGEDKSGKGIRDTEKLLEEYLPDLTSSLIGSVIILGQGLPQRFSNNTPSGRKEVLEKLSKSDFMIADLKERISSRKTELSKNLRDKEDEMLSNNTKKTMIENQLKVDTEKLGLMSNESIKQNLDLATKLKLNIEGEVNSLTEIINSSKVELEAVNKTLDEIVDKNNEKYDKLTEKYSELLSKAHDKVLTKESEISSLEKQIKQLESVRDTCPTCGHKLEGVEKVDTTKHRQELEKLKTQYSELNSRYEEIKKQKEDEIEAFCDMSDETTGPSEKRIKELEKIIEENSWEIEGKNKQLNETINSITRYTTEIDNFESNKKALEDTIKSNQAELSQISEKILYNNSEKEDINQHLDVVNKMSTSITRDFRGYLLTNVIDFINKKSKEYSQEVFETDKIDFKLDGNNISISYDSKEYENLSGGEKQKVDLIVQFAIRDMLCKFLDFSSNIIVLDELFDNLDDIGCQKVLSLISTKLSDVDSIFIVTHHADISIPADKEITVVKGKDKISRIK